VTWVENKQFVFGYAFASSQNHTLWTDWCQIFSTAMLIERTRSTCRSRVLAKTKESNLERNTSFDKVDTEQSVGVRVWHKFPGFAQIKPTIHSDCIFPVFKFDCYQAFAAPWRYFVDVYLIVVMPCVPFAQCMLQVYLEQRTNSFRTVFNASKKMVKRSTCGCRAKCTIHHSGVLLKQCN
jgi:hypothetical protein